MSVFTFLTNKKITPIKIAVGVTLCVVVVVLATFITTISLRPLRYTPLVKPNIVSIDPKVAYALIEANKDNYIVVDVRSPYEYWLSHASSSISIPINELFDGWKKLPMNKDKEILLLCTSGKLAGVAYGFLEHQGFRNITRIEGGLQGWRAEGLPIIAQDLFDKSVQKSTKNKGLDIPFINR